MSQTSLKITKVFYLLRFCNETRGSVLYLGFRYFELHDIFNYEIFIHEFQFV